MRSLGLLLITAAIAFAFEYGLAPVKVNDKVYCFFGKPEVMDTINNGNMVNSCFVDTGKSWLVIDSGPTYLYAQEAHRLVNTIKNMPVSYVINTHTHDDHWLGNGYFLSVGATILGSAEFKDLLNANETPRMERRISPEAYSSTVPTIPTQFIRKDEMLKINKMGIQIHYVDHKAHTQNDLFVYIPEIKTLFAGDLIFNERLPSIRDGDITGWIKILKKIKKMDLNTVVGGHGKLTGTSALEMTYTYLSELRDEVQDAIDKELEIDEAVKTIKMPKYKSIAFYNEIHRQNVEVVYRMLEWENE